MLLSPHFSLEEMLATQHRGIDNTPTPEIVERLKKTALGLEAVRIRLGAPIIITSGYRCPELNKAVGGQPNSQHMTGEAVDFICPGFGSPMTVCSSLVDSGIEYDQLIVEFGRWTHMSFTSNPRRQALAIDDTGTRPMFS
jgi:hypothetical protein